MGTRVLFIKGKYKGQQGCVTRVTAKMAEVRIDGKTESTGLVPMTSLKMPARAPGLQNICENTGTGRPVNPPAPVGAGPSPVCVGTGVSFIKGKYKGQQGFVTRVTAKMAEVRIDGKTESTGLVPLGSLKVKLPFMSSGGAAPSDIETQSSASEALCRVDDLPCLRARAGDQTWAGPSLGSLKIVRTYLTAKRQMDCIFSLWLQNQYEEVEISLEGPPPSLEREFVKEGRKFALAGAKMHDDGSGLFGMKKKSLRMVFVATEGVGISTISLEDELGKLANFGALNPAKAKARLELLQSPAASLSHKKGPKKAVWGSLSSDLLEPIEEEGNVGCGFIAEELLENLLGKNLGAKTLAIQVRIVAPRFGLFKGMLMRRSGITTIQLPPSMKKAGPSLTSDEETMFLLITTGGLHPSKLNGYIGRALDENLKPPPARSFTREVRKLSEMIERLWEGESVPKSVIKNYKKQASFPAGALSSRSALKSLKHAFVVGVADPTGLLPPGHIFVTGAGAVRTSPELFITRSPCVVPSDGRVLPVVTTKPAEMSVSEWSWLEDLQFGCVIFGAPSEQGEAIPETIASGDLDGDLYFVCWDEGILSHVSPPSPLPLPPPASEPQASQQNLRNSPETGWLERAQNIMLDVPRLRDIDAVIGKLYNFAKSYEDPSDLEAVAFGNAYKQALETGKHGTKPDLPKALLEKLPQKWHHLLNGV
jgi:ribosomal protein L24